MAVFGDKVFFGLDIGATGMRLVQLKPSGGKPPLITYGSVEMPAGLFQSDSPADRDAIATIVKELVRGAKINTDQVAVALPGARVYTTVVKVPKLTESELASAIQWQAEQNLPLGLDEVKLSWSVLPQEKESPNGEMEVLLVAAPLSIVEKYTEIMSKAELEITALEINPLASARSLVAPGAGTVMIIDIGAIDTEIAVIHNGVVFLVRSVAVAGDAFTRAISKGLGLDITQAEQFKHKFGLMEDKLEGQVLKALVPIVETIVEEIKRTMKFFEEQKPGVAISRVILAGRSAGMPELPLYIANSVGLEVELGDAWSAISYPSSNQARLSELALEFHIAAGLALRGIR